MCGIAGYFNRRGTIPAAEKDVIGEMTDTLLHRGPDDGGTWSDAKDGVALGNRRLAIIDLSQAGHQPMTSSCGRYVIAYNGEIYNTSDLRAELEKKGRTFRGHSDTEVIVEGCAVWGVEKTVQRMIGMFALALWDKREKRLFIVRDRLGIKPLYWTLAGDTLIFGSELKAIAPHPAFESRIDRNAVASYLRHNYVPAPHTIYEDVHKLEPGCILTLAQEGEVKITSFWSLDDVVQEGLHSPFKGSDAEAEERLDQLVRDAVFRRMVSDVPLGAFLSGGIDSATIVGAMQAQSNRPVRTYSIGYEHEDYDEAKDAAAIAAHLGTDHTELTATPEDARNVIPDLPTIYDEPFADSSQIPTYLVSRLTKQHVTVALSGDGGDELFGGYTRYFTAEKYRWPLFGAPCALRGSAAWAIRSLSPVSWNRLGSVIPRDKRPEQLGEQLHKLAGVLGAGEKGFYLNLISQWSDPERLVDGTDEYETLAWDRELSKRIPDIVPRMQYLDTATYLPDDILTKVDRASMAVSLEARVPLLDHRIVEFAWSLPQDMKIRNGVGKWLLRRVLRRYVPERLVARQKRGFTVPVGDWLHGPLKEWAEDLLSPEALAKHGLIRPEPVQRAWNDHLSGAASQPLKLWSILMLQSWCETQSRAS